MKKYIVQEKVATFGVGIVLSLTDQQAAIRKDNLKKVKNGYIVNEAVSFKKGEVIGIVEGNVPKKLLSSLSETDKENAKNDNTEKSKNNQAQQKG